MSGCCENTRLEPLTRFATLATLSLKGDEGCGLDVLVRGSEPWFIRRTVEPYAYVIVRLKACSDTTE